jgi:uncharacterized membrane protein YbaN (DUF454 family)
MMARRRRMSLALKRKLYLVGAGCFFVLGVLGLFLPILQGILFLLVSLVLFARGSARGRLLRRKFIKRYPQWGGKLQSAEHWLSGLPRRLKRKLGWR